MRTTTSRRLLRRVLYILGRCLRIFVVALAAIGPAPPPPPPPPPARIEARAETEAEPDD